MTALEKMGLIAIVLLGNSGLLVASIILGLCSAPNDFEASTIVTIAAYFLVLTVLLIALLYAWKEGLPCPL